MKSLILALLLVASIAFPTLAAEGTHASFFSESSFLTLAKGSEGTLSVAFVNTGTTPWVGAELHTNFPLNNTSAADQGWASGWPSKTVMAMQQPEVVAPGAIAFFTYGVSVPETLVPQFNFYGRVVMNGVPMEDAGYFQTVTSGKPSGFNAAVKPATGPVDPSQNRYSGRVFDQYNSPIAGVCVYAGPPSGCPDPALVTDDHGYWAVDLPKGLRWQFNFEHPDYTSGRVLNDLLQFSVDTYLKPKGYGSPPSVPNTVTVPQTVTTPAPTLPPVEKFTLSGNVQIPSYQVGQWTVTVFKDGAAVTSTTTQDAYSFSLPSGVYKVQFTPPFILTNNHGWQTKWWTTDGKGSYTGGSEIVLPGKASDISPQYL